MLLALEPGAAPAFSVPFKCAVADGDREVDEPDGEREADESDGEREADEPDGETEDGTGDGFGHTFVYTNCSGAPLQAVADPASYVPFG